MPWLSVLILLPLFGVAILALWRGASDAQARAVALLVAIVLIIMIAPLFWRRAKSRVVQVLTALLEIQVTT